MQNYDDLLVRIALGHVVACVSHAHLRRHLPAVEVALVGEETKYLMLHVGALRPRLPRLVMPHGLPRVCHLLEPALFTDDVLRVVRESFVPVP